MRTTTSTITIALLAALAAGTASADGFTGTIGYENSHPSGNNGKINGVANDADSSWAFTGSLGYYFNDHFSADAWSGLNEFDHTISQGGADVAKVKVRPMALTANYHFLPGQKFNPYVGIGYGWTNVSGETGLGTLTGHAIKADNDSGLSYVIGADVPVSDTVFLRGSARHLQADSNVTVDGAAAGNVKLDPWVYGVSVGFKF